MPVDRGWLVLGAETLSLVTACAVLAGVPLAWMLENRQFAAKPAISAIVRAAILLPAPLLIYLLVSRSLSLAAMSAAGVVAVLPLVTRQMRAAFAGLDRSYGKAARSLGVPESLVFARVELPLVRRAAAAAAAWALARLALEFAAAFWISRLRA
ncbi:MAG TPA: ABC transporter permease subunit [Bryobacteraceae bacterium]|nr:ABC transporter permease subunit [Bryobacteraceae bacterium]